ncbi:MAG TPA: hypothetical protein VG940_11925 [Gemmatimonadales bacterium]|nr:hypothetical protein [Gemmatimonadales bacterium]
MLILLLALAAGPLPSQSPDPAAKAFIDTALARMGGRDAVARVQRVRREMLTTWQRTGFRNEPYADAPSYELHTDIRDYGLRAWRNTRKFSLTPGGPQIVDIVRDTVAIRQGPNGVWAPLNIAYVDELREIFAIAPEHLLLVASEAPDLALGRDTTIDGGAVARVTATVEGHRVTMFFRKGDGLLAMTRFHAAQPNDFGLVQWGAMDVETWYSRWARFPVGAALPTQIDQMRLGRPYKRMTVLSAAFDTVTTAETFAISDSLRDAYFATATKPMHDLPLDSAKVVEGTYASFGAFGTPPGAVKIGGRWVLFEAGQAGLSAERSLDWLARTDAATPVAAAILTQTSAGNGGVTVLGRRRIATWIAPGAKPFVDRMLGNTGIAGTTPTVVARAQWLRVGTDSLWLEPIDLPDAPRTMLVYSPTLKWAYNTAAAAPLQQQYLLRILRGRGWAVEKVGHARAISVAAPASR